AYSRWWSVRSWATSTRSSQLARTASFDSSAVRRSRAAPRSACHSRVTRAAPGGSDKTALPLADSAANAARNAAEMCPHARDRLCDVSVERVAVCALPPGIDTTRQLNPLHDFLRHHGERKHGREGMAAVERGDQ